MFKIQRKSKQNNRGFSLVELLIAVAILAVIGVTIALFMGSSSRTYSKENADATIQAEAQVVANAISDRIIDCNDRINYDNTLTVSINGLPSNQSAEDSSIPRFGDTEGKILEIANEKEKEMLLLDRDTKQILYLNTSRASTAVAFPNYEFANAEVLAQNVSDFVVKTDRYAKEHIIWFTMTYVKEMKQYTGTYQVNVRNHITINDPDEIKPDETNRVTGLIISPQETYINIKGNDVYDESGAKLNKIHFVCTYRPFNAKNVKPVWSMMPDADTGCTLATDPDSDLLADLTTTPGNPYAYTMKHFRVFAKHTNAPDDVVEAVSNVYVRKINSIAIQDIDGMRIDPDNNQKYALPGSRVVLDASVDGWYLDAAKYTNVKWGVHCNDSSCCTPANKTAGIDCKKLAGVSAIGKRISITLKSTDAIGRVYTATATSTWDDTKTASFNIPVKVGDASYRPLIRGANISVNDYAALFGAQGFPQCLEVTGAHVYQVEPNFDNTSADFAKIVKPDFTLYVDHNPANLHYYDSRKIQFYGPLRILLRLQGTFADSNGNVQQAGPDCYISFDPVSVHKTTNDICDAMKKWSRTSKADRDAMVAAGSDQTADQLMKKMKKLDTDNEVIVVRKGYSKPIHVYTHGYNIVDAKLIGIYAGADETSKGSNLNNGGTNNYLTAQVTSTVGTRDNAVDNIMINVNAINEKVSKQYPVDAITLRVGIDHFYNCFSAADLASGAKTKEISAKASYTEYKVYVANVEGTDIFIPTPENKEFKDKVGTLAVNANKPVKLGPKNTSVNIKKLDNDKYMLSYNNNTYVYNKANRYWREQ